MGDCFARGAPHGACQFVCAQGNTARLLAAFSRLVGHCACTAPVTPCVGEPAEPHLSLPRLQMVRQGESRRVDDRAAGEGQRLSARVQSGMWHMIRRYALSLRLAILALSAPLLAARAQPVCGVERWPVKVLADRDRAAVRLNDAVPATVRELGALEIPEIIYPNDRRIAPHELRVYRLTAIVWQINIAEDDRDWHVVLRDPVDNSMMIVEIPDPRCTRDPALAARFQAARAELRRVPKRGQATFTGVGFWDFIHNQRGRARNGFELHPVLAVEAR